MTAKLTIDPAFRIGEIDPRLYGSFLEHVGRCVYGGIHDPGHPTADDLGFRQDLLAEARELRIPLYRYPGGCFVSAYDWEHGIGPRAERPQVLDLAWRTIAPNEVGVDEFATWAKRAGAEPLMVVNMGTRGLDAARDLIEYCNHPGGTSWSDRRRANGYPEAHAIKVWGLGNEPESNFELGTKTALEYGVAARETAKAMRRIDPSIELVACGGTNYRMPNFPAWCETVLEHVYDVVDHVAIHDYYGNREDDVETYLASTLEMEEFIAATLATCDYVRAKLRASKRLTISFDEWNVLWYHSAEADKAIPPWTVAPPFMEDVFTMEDALLVGCMLITLLRHADRVKIACQSTLVNNVGMFLAEPGGPLWRQTTYYPFRHASLYGRGVALDVAIDSPRYENRRFGSVPTLAAVATIDEARDEAAIFAVNREPQEALPLAVDLRALPGYRVIEHLTLEHPDPKARNTRAAPATVVPHATGDATIDGGRLRATLGPLSWHTIRLGRPPR